MEAFCIDLDSKNPEVLEFSGPELEEDMRYYNASSPLDLTDPDRRVFLTEEDAEKFLDTYTRALRTLSNERICVSRELPGMLYKRRYIVLSLLGLKTKTVRHYRRDWKPGQLFNLHDQTFFLTVELTELVEREDGYFEYRFKII